MAETEEIEVNFRLDRHGRTQNTHQAIVPPSSNGDDDVGGDATTTKTIENLIDYNPKTNDVQFVSTSSSSNSKKAVDDDDNDHDVDDQQLLLLDELLYDCEISDCGLMPRTYWVPAASPDNNNKFQPRFSLEQMALDVFRYHTRKIIVGAISDDETTTTRDHDDHNNNLIDMTTSGAEWWVQIRPSPEKTGRYSMLESNDDSASSNKKDLPKDEEEGGDSNVITTEDISKNGISLHWDKDEDLRLLCGANVHPHLSTVTYLTDIGAPTIAFNYRVNNLTGEYIDPSNNNEDEDGHQAASAVEALVSWPLKGKHLSFDGRFLHAAPSDLMEYGKFEDQCKVQVPPNDDQQHDSSIMKRLARRHRRVTFLVNIWLNYHPFDVKPFPDTMVDKMSGSSGSSDKTTKRRAKLVFSDSSSNDVDGDTTKETTADGSSSSSPHHNVNVTIKDGKVVKSENNSRHHHQQSSTTTSKTCQTYVWPMGDCGSGETIRAAMPLNEIRSMADCGGNVKISWCTPNTNDVQLLRVRDGDGANANNDKDIASNINKRQKVE